MKRIRATRLLGRVFLVLGLLGSPVTMALIDRRESPPVGAQTPQLCEPIVEAGQTLRFESYRNLVVLPVRVNGSRPLTFVLDSGSGVGMIDRARAKELRLNLEEGGEGIGGGDRTFRYQLARKIALGFAGNEVCVHSIRVVDLSHMQLVFGRPVDGTLGYPIFARYVVAVDHDKRTVSFFDPKTYVYKGGGDRIPITIQHNVPYLTAELKLYGQNQVTVKFLIDTGAATTNVAHDMIATAPRKLEAITGVGLGNERQGFAARVEKLKLGRFVIESAHGRTGTWSLIGGGILSRFNMVFDYSRKLLILEPNGRFGDAYPYDASGMVLRRAEDLKSFRVHHVLPDSPAAELGLRREDTITAIDGRNAAVYDLTEVQNLFKRNGEQHRLQIRRGDKQWEATIKLRELL
jgi:hypothetical protein